MIILRFVAFEDVADEWLAYLIAPLHLTHLVQLPYVKTLITIPAFQFTQLTIQLLQ